MNIPNALKQLFPTADPLRDWRVQDNGSGAAIVMWNLQATQPTPAQLQAASDAYDVAAAQAASDASTLHTQVVTVATTAVGTLITNLTANQVRALLAVLLWKQNALTPLGAVRPLAEWGV